MGLGGAVLATAVLTNFIKIMVPPSTPQLWHHTSSVCQDAASPPC